MRHSHLIVFSIVLMGLFLTPSFGQDSTKVKDRGQQLERTFVNNEVNELASSLKIKENNARPTEFMLNQNYPNPFNPTTIITYQIKESDYVQLKVYDVLCHEVALLVDKVQPSGYYQLTFDGNNLSDGIYFYRLQCGNYVDVKKMVLVK
jgi:Secretion system C-terminal sorting domain